MSHLLGYLVKIENVKVLYFFGLFFAQSFYALSIIDRLSGAKELFAKKGIEFGSILTIDDIAEKTYKKID